MYGDSADEKFPLCDFSKYRSTVQALGGAAYIAGSIPSAYWGVSNVGGPCGGSGGGAITASNGKSVIPSEVAGVAGCGAQLPLPPPTYTHTGGRGGVGGGGGCGGGGGGCGGGGCGGVGCGGGG